MTTVPGFDMQTLNFQGAARDVYRAGRGPAVIVMSEIPGITPAVAGFAQRLVDAGYTVFMPLRATPMPRVVAAASGRSACVSPAILPWP
jgi:dienelactone hydrolase